MRNWMTVTTLLTMLGGAATPCLSQTEQAQQVVEVSEHKKVMDSLEGSRVEVTGDGVLVLRGEPSDFADGEVHLSQSEPEARVVIYEVLPSVANAEYLPFIFVDGKPAVHLENVRVVRGPDGAVVVPHGPDFEALLTHNEAGLDGTARGYVVHKYYKSAELGEDEDKIASFRLKRGYMATLAENEDGTGASEVFIAADRDLVMDRLPEDLQGKVSFIRVFPWRHTGKKGYGGRTDISAMVDPQWYYNWGAKGGSTLDMEYVAMRHNKNWASFETINALENVTHLLGFNEPNKEDQADMTVEEALDMWPKLQESGLRLGSPCPNDAQSGLEWLYAFMEGADERGYRVDFVCVHYYKADWSGERLIEWLGEISKRTGGRPIWLTEFNNGAPWVKGHEPTYAENIENIGELCRAMDEAEFVERYAIFNCGPDEKQRRLVKQGELTPLGEWYKAYEGADPE